MGAMQRFSALLVLATLACGSSAPAEEPAKAAPELAEAEAPAEPEQHLVPAKIVPKELPPIYSEKGEMKAELDAALKRAGEGSKRVLVIFGGNWCQWCHKLDMLFERHEGIKNLLAASFVRVNVDSNTNEELIADLGVELQGVPFLAVLEPDGKIVVKQETGSLEEGPRHDPAKVLAFLQKWKPST